MILSIDEAQDQLSEACQSGDAERVSQLFASQSLNADDATNALRDAYMDDFMLIHVLLQNGADVSVVNLRDIQGCARANDLLRHLAEYEYDFRSEGHIVLQDFTHDRETLDWLLDQGVNINRTDSQRLEDGFNLAIGETDNSLHLLNNVAADGNIDLFDHLVSKGANTSRSLVLHSASRCEAPSTSRAMVCHLLDKHNMDIDGDNEYLRDFMHDADDSGSPLCSAILHRNLAVVQELLQRGASPGKPLSKPAYHAMKADGFLPALEPLLLAGIASTDLLLTAVYCMNVDAAKICLDFGADPAPALQKVLENEQARVKRQSEVDHEKDEEDLEEEKAAGQRSKAMKDLLNSAIKFDAVHGNTSS